MKKKGLIYLFLLLIPVLTACRIDLAGKEEFERASAEKQRIDIQSEASQTVGNSNEEDRESPEEDQEEKQQKVPNAKPSYTLEGTAAITDNQIEITGNTSLPPGAIITARLRRYGNDTSLEDIKEYRVEPGSIVDGEVYMEVNSDGTFESTGRLERGNLPFRYRLELFFLPERASEEIKNQLSGEGGNFDNLAGTIPIDTFTTNPHLKPVVNGYIKYLNILKKDETEGDNVLEFEPVRYMP
jgi:hypothetical protein